MPDSTYKWYEPQPFWRRALPWAALLGSLAVAVIAMTVNGWSRIRLGIGAFLTSPGFGGAAAVLAAMIAYRVGRDRVAADLSMDNQRRQVEREAAAQQRRDALRESRERQWFDLLMSLTRDLREELDAGGPRAVAVASALAAQARSEWQVAILAALAADVLSVDTGGDSAGGPTGGANDDSADH